ncbi:hypothetical protein HYU95_02485 [Candidatus Daviesbacteria bacterium]|nr:hypothetical protein [Candidatus Daviesbacteria bacterium]
MEREDSLVQESDVLGPVKEWATSFRSRGSKEIMPDKVKFMEGKDDGLLEIWYQRWRAGYTPEWRDYMTKLIQEDPSLERGARGLFLESMLDQLERKGQPVQKTSPEPNHVSINDIPS